MIMLKIFFVLCLIQAFTLETEAKSVMHQIYAAEYGIMATLFLCSIFIINAINNKNGREANDQNHKIVKDGDNKRKKQD